MNEDETFLNYGKIITHKNEKINQIDTDSLEWGKEVLGRLNLNHLTAKEKGQKICKYLNQTFSYTFKRRLLMSEIIKKKGGNCVSHAIISIYLLRLAGVPAKIAHEVHLTKQFRPISITVGLWAKKENNGINSFWHNDHVWVWYKDSEGWKPFDSVLNICGFDQFYNKRFFKHKELSQGIVQRWTGPPFIIWQSVSRDFEGMENITSSILNQETLSGLDFIEDWLTFIRLFLNWQQNNFYAEYLPRQLIGEIRSMSIRWFKK